MSIDLSLDRIKALVSQFDAYTCPTVHIAGTNGKGSVSALLGSIFKRAGLSVGRFNSPHLLHPSDSITLNGIPVSRDTFQKTMEEIQRKNDMHSINASNFEVLTVCALVIFERAKVDVVLLEVGMGGRLDATNVVPDNCILVSVITSIDLDHQAFLGSTIEAIAREKAGIIRKDTPVVVAPQKHPSVYSVVEQVAKEKVARVIIAPSAEEREWDESIDGERLPPFSLRPFVQDPPQPVQVLQSGMTELQGDDSSKSYTDQLTKYRVLLPLHGPHQLGNLGAALTVLHILRSRSGHTKTSSDRSDRSAIYEKLSQMNEITIHRAVHECSWPGRLSFHEYYPGSTNEDSGSAEKRKPLAVLVDGAHNEAAARTLSSYVSSLLTSLAGRSPQVGEGMAKKRQMRMTFILALSHSPPKTPESVLVPLLEPFLDIPEGGGSSSQSWKDVIDLKPRIAFVTFSPPDGMPWVKPVPPPVMKDAFHRSFPNDTTIEIWSVPDGAFTDRTDATENLEKALRWASDGHEEGPQDDANDENFVLIAGSLYLVADFYRLLEDQEPRRDR